MTLQPWAPTPERQSATAASSRSWTLALVVALLWLATPTGALYVVNASSSKPTEDRLPPSTISRCAPLSHDVLWTRLNLVAPRLTLLESNDAGDDEDDAEVSRTQLSPPSDDEWSLPGQFQTSRSVVSQTVTMSTNSHHRRNSRHRRRRRRRRLWRRRDDRERSRRQGRASRRRSEPTSWNCRLQKRWKRMPSGVFPAYIQTGSCSTQPTCMLGMYACRPRRYLIKVLRRVGAGDLDDGCRPVPVAASDALYEEAWSLVDVSVTVACECSRRRRSGMYHRRPTDST